MKSRLGDKGVGGGGRGSLEGLVRGCRGSVCLSSCDPEWFVVGVGLIRPPILGLSDAQIQSFSGI